MVWKLLIDFKYNTSNQTSLHVEAVMCLISGVVHCGLLMWPEWAIGGEWGMRLMLDFGKCLA
jgi:hypothetical protein